MKRHLFTLEHLEGRALYSVVAPMDVEPTMATTAVHATPQATVSILHPFPAPFNVAGTFTHPIGPIGNPDTGSVYYFKGTGKTVTLGMFSLKGHITLPGFVANGRAVGKFTITTARGTISFSVTGPPQAPGSLPSSLTYKITKGTGPYVNSTGNGKIVLSASGTTQKFLFRFQPTS